MNLLWATRGRTWGFRFLLNGGSDDPLPTYDSAFSGIEDQSQVCRRVAGTAFPEEIVALRFPDPLGRQDSAGRVIPHDFVVFPPLAREINSVEDGLQRVWPLVAENFAELWDKPKPRSVNR